MARADTDNGHGQGAGGNKKLKPANRFKKKPGLTNEELAAIGRKTLRERLNVETFEEVLEEIRNRKIAQPFVRKSRENYHEAIGEALALLYAAKIRPDPIRALKSLLPEAEYRVRKDTTAAQLALRVVIDYGHALVPPIKLERVDPVTQPTYARKQLAAALMIYGAKLWPKKVHTAKPPKPWEARLAGFRVRGRAPR
jgi:hypothetical protein